MQNQCSRMMVEQLFFFSSRLAQVHGKRRDDASRELGPECSSVTGRGGGGSNSVYSKLQTNRTPQRCRVTRPAVPLANALSESHPKDETDSIFLLTLMSCERYTAVVHPFEAGRRAQRCRRPLAIAIWLLSFALALPMMVMIHQEERSFGDGAVVRRLCSPTWSEEQYKVYLSILFSTSIVAPGIIIGVLYWRLARTYWLSQTRGGSGRSPKNRVFLLIFVIVLAFWACYLPFWIWQLLPLYCASAAQLPVHTEISINHLVTCLTYGNSCINPFLYTLLTRNYREYLRARQSGTTRASLRCLQSRGRPRGGKRGGLRRCRSVTYAEKDLMGGTLPEKFPGSAFILFLGKQYQEVGVI
ncbi:hypothetical protein lerEdw1_009269 [Lerista edwardsae]|nr:hypothetical protein lerEdw1_009269 [Lerista edwardsae]